VPAQTGASRPELGRQTRFWDPEVRIAKKALTPRPKRVWFVEQDVMVPEKGLNLRESDPEPW